jgi:two-component system, chemotaxis family, protein-glutamate methylesterase/glutaminase
VPKIRVVVVEDSLTVRKRLLEVLGSDAELEVVAEGEDGRSAIELCERLRPDVITLDMMLPVMSGLAATEYIMAHRPTPILIVSASTQRGELFRTYDALAAGAVDVLEKPLGDERDEAWERRLIATVKLVSRIKVITHPRAKLALRPSVERHVLDSRASAYRAVAIGVSTGGPAALQEVLGNLPADFPLPVLVVIHIAEPFGSAFAEWLDGQSPLRVAYARDGETLPPVGRARVLMAPPASHLVLEGETLRLTAGAERHSCRPSVDVLFESIARCLGRRGIGCLLTGMGRDGAAGLLQIRRSGGATLAQDEASSVVYGMPREAALLGAAEQVLPLGEFASAIVAISRRT